MGTYKVDVDYRPFYKYIRQVRRRSENFAGVFRAAMRDLEREHADNFRSSGKGRWEPLDTGYADWKTKEYGGGGILVRTGDLKRSLSMSNARGAIRNIGRKRAEFGTSVNYAHFHQTGTEDMPQRTVLFTPNRFAEGLAKDAIDYLAYGRDAQGAMKRAANIGRR